MTTLIAASALAFMAPPPADGLLLWLDASDEGAHADLRIACEARGPGQAFHFDGRTDVILIPDLGATAEEWTLIAVIAPLEPVGGAIASACPAGGNDFDPGFTVDLFGAFGALNYLSVEGAGRIGGRHNQRTGSSACGAFSVVTVVRERERIRLFVDGAEEAERAALPATTVMDQLRIGARFYGGRDREFFHGDVAEIILYARALSDAERRDIEQPRIPTAEQIAAGVAYNMERKQQRDESRMIPPTVVSEWPTIADGPLLPLEDMPVRTDLLAAIRLAMHCLNSSFDADRDGEPFFYSNRREDGLAEFHHSVHIGIPHVVGRCLLGNMAASRATGIPFPEDGLAILTRFLKGSFDNEDHLNSYYDPEKGGARGVEFHNMREGLYGLWALMFTDEADWAKRTARLMLGRLDQLTDETGRWSVELARELGMADRCSGLATPNSARMVEPLLAVHRATGDPLALKLAETYARSGLEGIFTPDGRFAEMAKSSGHVHSITSSLAGIVEFAILVGDEAMLDHCRRIIDVGVPEYFSSWGWGDEVYPDHPADEPSRGEINQTADVIRAALMLGAAGEPRYYELAERYLRSMLLSTQHTEDDLRRFVRDWPEPGNDARRDVIARSAGGFSMQLPNDRMREGDWPLQTQDITSGALHAMAECWRARVTDDGETARVNLLLDVETDALRITSALPLEGRLAFEIREPRRVRIRIPEWADPPTVRATLGERTWSPAITDGYTDLGALRAGDAGTLTFDVPVRIERETVDGIEYTTTWLGNQVIDIQPRGTVSPLPF